MATNYLGRFQQEQISEYRQARNLVQAEIRRQQEGLRHELAQAIQHFFDESMKPCENLAAQLRHIERYHDNDNGAPNLKIKAMQQLRSFKLYLPQIDDTLSSLETTAIESIASSCEAARKQLTGVRLLREIA